MQLYQRSKNELHRCGLLAAITCRTLAPIRTCNRVCTWPTDQLIWHCIVCVGSGAKPPAVPEATCLHRLLSPYCTTHVLVNSVSYFYVCEWANPGFPFSTSPGHCHHGYDS